MIVKLTNIQTKTHIAIGDVETVKISDNKTKIIDIYKDERIYNNAEWICACEEYAVCAHCGKKFFYSGETCAIYREDFICNNCYQNHYGYCNKCGELNKYIDMNEDVVCEGCE